MGTVKLGLNLEFSRHHNMSFERAVKEAARIGYDNVEPMVHIGRQLLSEGGFFHSISMSEDPLEVKGYCESQGVGISALSSHSHLCKPEISVEYLRQGIRWAGEMGVPVVNTSEGFKRSWTNEEEDLVLIRYSLKMALEFAEKRGVLVGMEPHHQYSGSLEGMDRLLALSDSDMLGVNFDTGNAYLGGKSDIYSWLAHISQKLVHLHAKDISIRQSDEERGRVSGTAVGCACGDGVVDWKRVVEICREAPRDIVMSVECGTLEEAEKSYVYLREVLQS
jgi:sugar phosphate isomerase/epimerase